MDGGMFATSTADLDASIDRESGALELSPQHVQLLQILVRGF